ncbi:unnamed protein product [Microthlaspi erraticum]|uniref:Peptidase M16 middle/third domain-containing protein n=1 Tax=Microthlaspi erraticum TaxID=1685480 RepID=A0A6D2KUL5_9BRAS|nr:unnamed protein product [Microthlaspi erraticum]
MWGLLLQDIAENIKKEFDKKHTATWHCIVGHNFGISWCSKVEERVFYYPFFRLWNSNLKESSAAGWDWQKLYDGLEQAFITEEGGDEFDDTEECEDLFDNTGKTDKAEPWCNTAYSLEKITEFTIHEWMKSAPHVNLLLPTPNVFIPTDFVIKRCYRQEHVSCFVEKDTILKIVVYAGYEVLQTKGFQLPSCSQLSFKYFRLAAYGLFE